MSERALPAGSKDDDSDPNGPEDDKPMTFWEHIEELRKRMIYAMVSLVAGCAVAWSYKQQILNAIYKPFREAWIKAHVEGEPSLHFMKPGADFTAYIKLSLIGGAALASPFIFYQLWSFIAPGLYSKEKRYVIPFVIVSTALFVGGGWFAYLAAFPVTFGYFLGFAGDVGGEGTVKIVPTIGMEDYIDFVLHVLLGFGLIFEIPILLSFLAKVGVVNHRMLIKFARYYVFIAFLASAILAPPDATSMMVMALPAIVLYFASIGLVYFFQAPEHRMSDKQKLAHALAEKEREEREAREEQEAEKAKERLAAKKARAAETKLAEETSSEEVVIKKKKKKKKPTEES